MTGKKRVPYAEEIGKTVHISQRVTDTNCTYISQWITGQYRWKFRQRFRQSTISRRKALLDIVHDLADLW